MNKQLFILLFAVCSGMGVAAQTAIPNGNFETWNSVSFDHPQYYPFTSNQESYFRCKTGLNATKTTDAHHGSNAIQLTTTGSLIDTCIGYFINASSTNGSPATWKGGMPITGHPTGIRGYYKYNGTGMDSGALILSFFKGGVNIGVYFYLIGGNKTSYTLFDFTFAPALAMAPDSFIFGAASSNFMSSTGKGVAGSILKLDSISFTGLSSQPAQMNGDFEGWQSITIINPGSWYLDDGGRGEGISQTTDAAKGSFAIEMTTHLGQHDNKPPQADAARISTGYWDENCKCEKGGYPFSNMNDTLAFYYKYAPANSNDSAEVMLQFKKNGTMVGGWNMPLGATATYKYVEIPVNAFSTPDSVVVTIQSSMWKDTALSFIGAVLKIDEVHFKSQPLKTGIFEVSMESQVRMYPNPMKTHSIIQLNPLLDLQGMDFCLYDMLGRNVRRAKVDNHNIVLERNDLPSGTYIYELKNNSNFIKSGKIMVE